MKKNEKNLKFLIILTLILMTLKIGNLSYSTIQSF